MKVLEPNQWVGGQRYQLLSPLGAGRVGSTWLARGRKAGGTVSLRFLPPELLGHPGALAEVRAAFGRIRALNHPHIVPLHDLVLTGAGSPFVVMESVGGTTMQDFRRQHPNQVVSWDVVESWVRQLCHALRYAHCQNVIHGNLSPTNLLVDREGRLKLADFGLDDAVARALSGAGYAVPVRKDWHHRSPALWEGRQPTAADDVYALGSIFYEALTGTPPIAVDSQQPVEPEPLDRLRARLGQVNPVPAGASALIMACLAFRESDRPAQMDTVFQLLRGVSEAAPAGRIPLPAVLPAAIPPMMVDAPVRDGRVVEDDKKGRKRTAALIAILLLLLLLLALLWRTMPPPEVPEGLAEVDVPPGLAGPGAGGPGGGGGMGGMGGLGGMGSGGVGMGSGMGGGGGGGQSGGAGSGGQTGSGGGSGGGGQGSGGRSGGFGGLMGMGGAGQSAGTNIGSGGVGTRMGGQTGGNGTVASSSTQAGGPDSSRPTTTAPGAAMASAASPTNSAAAEEVPRTMANRRPGAAPLYRTTIVPPNRTELAPPTRTELSPPARAELAAPARTELAPPTRTELAPPMRTELAPPVRTELVPPARAEFAPPNRTELSPPVRAELAPPNRTELAPAGRAELAPPNRMELAPANRPELAAPNRMELAPPSRILDAPIRRMSPDSQSRTTVLPLKTNELGQPIMPANQR